MKDELEITPKTEVKAPLKILVSIFASMVVVVSTVVATWLDQKYAFESQIKELNMRVSQLAHDTVSINQQQSWIDTTREWNPTMKVPRLPEKGEIVRP